MSDTADVLVMLGNADTDHAAISALNKWLAEHADGQQLTPVDLAKCGGSKVPGTDLLAAGVSYLDADGFIAAFTRAPWYGSAYAYIQTQREREEGTASIVTPAGTVLHRIAEWARLLTDGQRDLGSHNVMRQLGEELLALIAAPDAPPEWRWRRPQRPPVPPLQDPAAVRLPLRPSHRRALLADLAAKAARWERIEAAWTAYQADGGTSSAWFGDSRDLMRELAGP